MNERHDRAILDDSTPTGVEDRRNLSVTRFCKRNREEIIAEAIRRAAHAFSTSILDSKFSYLVYSCVYRTTDGNRRRQCVSEACRISRLTANDPRTWF